MKYIRKELEEYKEFIKDGMEGTSYNTHRKYFKFFNEFFKKENLEKIQWGDVQKIRNNLNSTGMIKMAESKAFGRLNHPIEHYRKVFLYLIDESIPLQEKLRKVIDSKEGDYNIKYFGLSIWSEIFGNLYPNDLMIYNSRDRWVNENFEIVKFGKRNKGIRIPIKYSDSVKVLNILRTFTKK
ncbi:MAG: hypothetical protein ACTSVV_04025 [Promethearchaeota archaeon]